MGVCKSNVCCQDLEFIRTTENFLFQNTENDIDKTKEKIFFNNGKSINNDQLILSKKYY